MRRRDVLTISGVAIGGSAGCLGGSSGGTGGLPRDEDPTDGYPQTVSAPDEGREVDPSAYPTTTVDGIDVPLAPIDDVYYWYRRRAARFVDARGATQYDHAHVYGAVLSPAPAGRENDPVADWPPGDRIVCYCGCPHHLSAMRAANLIGNGYESVVVIDEGFGAWHERGYPMAGTDVTTQPVAYLVRGRTDPAFAGATVWAIHRPTGQREAGPISAAGTFELELRFYGVSPDSVVSVRTPEYGIQAPLRELETDVVTATTGR